MGIYLLLFLEFFKIGMFSFGGGLAMLPFIQEIVLKHNWISKNEFLDIVAISQVTPGPIAINAATFVGNKVKGIPGAFIATLGCIFPSFIIILIISNIFYKFKKNKRKEFFFKGVKPVILSLIVFAGVIVAKPTFTNPDISIPIKTIFIFILTFLGIQFVKINPIIFLILSALLGLIII